MLYGSRARDTLHTDTIPAEMAFDADFHAIADPVADLSYRGQARFDLRVGDALAEAALAKLIEGPDLHGVDFIVEQALRQFARVFVPSLIVLNIAKTQASIVGRDFFTGLATEQVIERRVVMLSHDVPKRDLEGGKRARFRAGITVIHDVIHDEAP